jgi:nucleoside-diphosphate-sugar epimerase
MKLLFIGGTGVISQAVSRLVVAQGHELYLFNRGNRRDLVPEGAKVIEGDVRDAATADEALRGHEWDAVVNWIVFTPEQAKADIERFRGKTRQYVFISSASAYRKPPRHYIITESTPLENPHWSYSRDKIACEKLLMEEFRASGFPVTIVRPSHTYGDTMIPTAINSRTKPWSIVDRMRRGKPVIVHGDGTSLWTVTHNTDFAVGFAGLLGRPEAIGEAYHITSDEVLTWNQIYDAIGRAAGVQPKLVHIASDFIVSHWPEMEGTLLGDKAASAVFDNAKVRALVPEFRPKVPFAEGIRRTIAWFEASADRRASDEGWNARCDRLIEAHERARGTFGG